MSNYASLYLAGLREAVNVSLPVATATAVEVGDLLKLVSGLVLPVTAAGDDATVIGFAVEAKAANVATTTGKITVALVDGISRMKVNLAVAATVAVGDQLEIVSRNTFVVGATDPVATVVEGGTTVSSVTAIFKRSPLI